MSENQISGIPKDYMTNSSVTQSQGAVPEIVRSEDAMTAVEDAIKFYGLAKPKRKIIRAKIIHDEDKD